MTDQGTQPEPESNGSPATRWMAVAAVAVLFAVLVGYYVMHKPIGVQGAAALLADLVRTLAAALVIWASGALGSRLAGSVSPSPAADMAAQAALGLGVFGLTWLVVGAAVGYSLWLSLLVLALVLIGLRRSAWCWLRQALEAVRQIRPMGAFEGCLAGAVGLMVIFNALEALAPPTHFDALVYHLALPSRFLAAGRFVFLPENPFWGSPLLAEMNYTWVMSMGGASAAAFLGLLVGILVLLGTYGLVASGWPRGGWAAVAALMAGETLARSLSWAYVDWLAALFGLGVVISLEAWRREGGWRQVGLAGAMAGFAMGTKYTAGVVLAAGLAEVILCGPADRRWRGVAWFLGISLLAFIAWPVKNLVATGAPLYPYLGSSPWVSGVQQAFFTGTSSAGFQAVGPLVPIFATIYGVESGPGYAASIGPLLLGLVLGGLAGPVKRRDLTGSLLVFVVAGWLVWGGASLFSELLGQSRLYQAIFPAWAALAGLGFIRLRSVRVRGVRLGRLTQALVLLAVALSLTDSIRQFSTSGALATDIGEETPEAYLTARLGGYYPAMQAVRNVQPHTKVVMLWEPRGYYCQPQCIPDPWIDRWYSLRRSGAGESAILQDWRAEGAGYILLNRTGMAFIEQEDTRYTAEDWSSLDALLGHLQLAQRIGAGYELYAIPG